MTKLNLRSFIKKNEVASLLTAVINHLHANIWIEDNSEKNILGTSQSISKFSYSIQSDEEIAGFVKGDENASAIADIINHLVKKEAEKKKLGSEVLSLYQEINLIFNFSEKLAQTINAPDICSITLDEARRIINSDDGVIILWDELTKKLKVIASSNETFFNEEKINKHLQVLSAFLLNGNSEIVSDTSALSDAGIILPEVKSVIYSALKVNLRVMGAIVLASNDDVQYTAANLKFLTTLALQSSAAIESALLYEKNIKEAREKEEAMRRIYEITAKFVPYEFIGSLGHKVITDVKLGDQVEKNVTVLFTDIRDYTSISEQMTPEENFQFVSSYNERMGPVIRNHNGFVNQYLGDAIMALFPESAEQSLSAAIEMQQNLREFNALQKAKNLPSIRMGIGMHTGPLVMGITGDKDRLDATTISDTVNTASRIESLTKYYKVNILLSEVTLHQILHPEMFCLRYLGKVQVKGKQSSIGIHECFSGDSEDQVNRKERTLLFFNEGIQYYLNRSFASAIKCFEDVTAINPEDRTAHFFLDNSIHYLQKGVSENWSGVVEMSSK